MILLTIQEGDERVYRYTVMQSMSTRDNIKINSKHVLRDGDIINIEGKIYLVNTVDNDTFRLLVTLFKAFKVEIVD